MDGEDPDGIHVGLREHRDGGTELVVGLELGPAQEATQARGLGVGELPGVLDHHPVEPPRVPVMSGGEADVHQPPFPHHGLDHLGDGPVRSLAVAVAEIGEGRGHHVGIAGRAVVVPPPPPTGSRSPR